MPRLTSPLKNEAHFILGGRDFEMDFIQRILTDMRLPFTHARYRGIRARGAGAYRYDPLYLKTLRGELIQVECASRRGASSVYDPQTGVEYPVARRIDHHRPGDPGYGQEPARYLEASSLGQLLAYLARSRLEELLRTPYACPVCPGDPGALEVEREDGTAVALCPTQELRMTAAADQCLHAAYKGECPGVDPDEFARFRLQTRATAQRRSVLAVVADLAAATERIEKAKATAPRWCGIPVLHETCNELPEAAARMAQPFVLKRQGKEVLQGADAPTISLWMQERKNEGYSVYGDPLRGFAGALRPERAYEKT